MRPFPLRHLLGLVVALLACQTPAMAASSEELADIRNQLRGLLARVDRLEQENEALEAQNEALQARVAGAEAPAAQPTTSAPPKSDKVNAAAWAERVTLKGDLRYRLEETRDDTRNAAGVRAAADRYRDRIRARLRAQVHATDHIDLGIGFATAEGSDPRSSNQTLGNVFSRKSVDLELAYFDWTFADWGHLLGGKMQQPFFRPRDSLFWDSDINPEGLALTFERGVLFGSAYGYWVNEVSGPQNTRTSDTRLFGGQIGARLPLGGSNLVLAAHYYDLSAGQGRAPFYNGNPNGNTTIERGTPPTAVLRYDYRVIDLAAEFNTRWAAPWGAVPWQLWADLAQNQDPGHLNTAWAGGATLGNAADARTWEIGAAYYSMEKDALFAQLIDADFGGGLSDANGWVLRAGYALMKNAVLNATYFINQRNVDVANAAGQTDVDFERLQLDLNVKF